MRKYVSLILAVLLFAMPVTVSAAEEAQEIEYLADGSYFLTTITAQGARANGSNTVSKTQHYYNANNELQWMITVTATFSYNGTSATCTYVTGTTSIVNTNSWYAISKTPSSSGNTATYTVTFEHKVLGVTVSKPTHSVSISCDGNGNFS